MSISVIIPRPGGPVLCGQQVCGTFLCGEALPADTYQDFPLELARGTAEVTTTTGTNITIVFDDSAALELVGSFGLIVNPVLTPIACIALDLDAITCTPLDLAVLVVEPLDLDPLVRQEA